MSHKMKILLTGSSSFCPNGERPPSRRGFIGSNFKTQYKTKYDITEWQGDIFDFGMYSPQYWKEFDMIVHLAAQAGVRRSHEYPEQYWRTNVEGSRVIFNTKVPVIYASSSSIYEWWLSPYATTKKVVETIAPYNSLGLRFHTVYGDNSRPDMLYDKLLRRDVSYLTGHTRDWTHVDDVCSAIDICIQNFNSLKLMNFAIDVGNGQPVSVIDVADKLWPNNRLPVKDVTGERENTCADPSILKSCGWKPKHFILD